MAQGAQGVAYLSDADPQGLDLGRRCRDAAAAVELPFILIDMRELFPDLPKGGSLDDVPDVGAGKTSSMPFAATKQGLRQLTS